MLRTASHLAQQLLPRGRLLLHFSPGLPRLLRGRQRLSVRMADAPLTTSTAGAAEQQQAQQQQQPQGQRRPRVRGVVFDMDGTLTVPVIDFQYMRQRVGVGPTGDILDIISSWPAEQQAVAHAAIAEIEEQALADMKAMPGMVELCRQLDSRGIPRGLITRNVLRSVEFFHAHHLPLPPFLPAISRECSFPYKPSPAALLHICESWGVAPGEVMMVGDSAKDDVVCGNRAAAVTVLLDTEGQWTPQRQAAELVGEMTPDVLVTSLQELADVLQERYELLPPEGLQQLRL